MKKYLLLILLCVLASANAQIYRTKILNQNIKTLQIGLVGQKFSLPVIELIGSDVLQISFDEMSHGAHAYSFKVIHCNADWTQSDLVINQYLTGYSTENITDVTKSLNTTFLYTHYAFQLPNSDMSFKVSGNYVVLIYEDTNIENPIAQACFSIVESRVAVSGKIRGNTDTELNGKLQQLDFEVAFNGYSVREPASEIKVMVRQNNRLDNQVTELQPTYMSSSSLSFINNKALIFEGGNEFHRFDISSVYAAGEGVAGIQFNKPYYDAYLYDNKIQSTHIYSSEMDVNGKFIVNMQNAQNDDTDADYMWVHFNLPTKQAFFDGQLFLGGEFNYNQLNDAVRMKYDGKTESYKQTVLLKQGGYNYQYRFVPKGEQKAIVGRVDGSFWQAGNEYTVYVYHRPWGERYDKLVGVKIINN
ncbi:MAG: type IX secretion system plug protein domain-containing protein [Paludibacter sp.]